jgi:hypothetical protein
MAFLRLTSFGFLALLPFLVACTQTTSSGSAEPGMPSEAPGSGVLAAITDARQTAARHRMTSVGLNLASSFDPTGLSGYAVNAVEETQQQIEDEKYRRIDAEVEKAIAEGLALQAQGQELEDQETTGKGRKVSRRKPTS